MYVLTESALCLRHFPKALQNNFQLHFTSQLVSIDYAKEPVKCSFG